MSKFILKLYVFFIIYEAYFFQVNNTTNITDTNKITDITNITNIINNSTFIEFDPNQSDITNATTNITNNESIKYSSTSMIQSIYTDSSSNDYYYTTLYMGRNFIKQTFLIDTNIDTLSSPCMNCFFCGKNKTNFYFYPIRNKKRIKCDSEICTDILPSIGCPNPFKSQRRKERCTFLSTKYNGDAFRGYFIKEEIYFEDIKPKSNLSDDKTYKSRYIPIGCTKAEFGKYKNLTIDGIMGLNNNKKSFIDILYKLKVIRKNFFTLCLGHWGGYLSIGGEMKEFRIGDKINYIKLLPSENSYLINATAIKVGNIAKKKIGVQGIIDSTSPITYFPNKLFKQVIRDFKNYSRNYTIKKKWKSFYYDKDYGFCTQFKNKRTLKEKIKLWPKINIFFSKTKFRWKPRNYIYKINRTTACLGINNHTHKHIIFGSNFMKENDFIFERHRNRIGFIKADCSKYIYLREINNKNKNHKENMTDDYVGTDTDLESRIEKKSRNTYVRNGIEYIRGRNNELVEFKNTSNIFNKIINILYYSFILITFGYIIIVLKTLCQYFDDDQRKLIFDTEE